MNMYFDEVLIYYESRWEYAVPRPILSQQESIVYSNNL